MSIKQLQDLDLLNLARILNALRVGIGTDNPTEALDVVGKINATLDVVTAGSFRGVHSYHTGPEPMSHFTDGTNSARLVLAGGDLYMQSATGKGLLFSGPSSGDLPYFQIRYGGQWRGVWHDGNLIKTTSDLDTTAGRMLQTRDFGIGVAILTTADLNTLTTGGNYYAVGSANRPPGTGNGYVTVPPYTSNASCLQVYREAGTEKEFQRRLRAGVWGDWVEQWNTDNLKAATPSVIGLMSPADKTKLNGIAAGAQVNVPTNLGLTKAATTATITSSTGTNATITAADNTNAGVMTAADKSKLDGITAGAQPNVATNITIARTATTATVNSSTGTGGSIAAADTTNAGVMSAADKTKLNGIATGATANASDAQLRDRSTHTGTQAISTVTGLQTALDGKVGTGDARLSDAREWTAAVVPQAEAEAGTATTARKWTAQRVRQAIAAFTEAFTSAEKTKLSGIAPGAQVNVATNLSLTRNATTATVASSTGASATIPAADGANAGVMSAADKTKLDGLSGGNTNLGATRSATKVALTSSTGTGVDLVAADGTNAGVMAAADKSKLDGIAAGAQVNPAFANATEAQAMLNAAKVLSPLLLKQAFQGSNQSMATGGSYQLLAGGWIIQVGLHTSSGAGVNNLTFPTAFPNELLGITGNVNIGAGANAAFVNFNMAGKTKTYCPMFVRSDSNSAYVSVSVVWIAVGY